MTNKKNYKIFEGNLKNSTCQHLFINEHKWITN